MKPSSGISPLSTRLKKGIDAGPARNDGFYDGGLGRGEKRRELREILSASCLVLLAPPGYGKSQEVRNLVERSAVDLPAETWLPVEGVWLTSEGDLRRLTLESELCTATLNEGGSVRIVIDAVDEAFRSYPRLLLDLIDLLRKRPRERVRLIITCRTAVWPQQSGDQLVALWPGHKGSGGTGAVHHLAPLRREEVELAAKVRGLDVRRFMTEVHKRGFEALAAQPLTLRMMLDLVREHRALPTTRWELFEKAARLLCEEHDFERAERVRLPRTAAHLHAAAERVAALMMVTGQPTLAADAAEKSGTVRCLTFDQVRGEERTANGTLSIDRVLLRQMVDTGLFTAAGSGVFVVYHASFMEHLAAAYFAGPNGTRFTVEQLRHILCDRVGDVEMVVPALIDVAAELAGVHGAWRGYLSAMHPQVFLHADLSSLGTTARADAVAAVLRGAEENRISDGVGTGRFLWSFAHEGLTHQLRPYLEDTSRPYIARRLAFRIAGACRLSDLESLMWERAEAGDPSVNELGHALEKEAGDAGGWATLEDAGQDADAQPAAGVSAEGERPKQKMGAHLEWVQLAARERGCRRVNSKRSSGPWDRSRAECRFTGGYTIVKEAVREFDAVPTGSVRLCGMTQARRTWILEEALARI